MGIKLKDPVYNFRYEPNAMFKRFDPEVGLALLDPSLAKMKGKEMTMEPVGFIGLGNMGSKMVERLLKAGYTVIGYNRTKEKAIPLIKLGMQWADSPIDVVKACNITLMSLTDDKAILAIIESEHGILSALTRRKIAS